EVDDIAAGAVALAADHAHVVRQGRAVLARLLAVDHEQAQNAARWHPHRPGRALLEARVDVFFPKIERLHDMHVGVDDLEAVFHLRPPAGWTMRWFPTTTTAVALSIALPGRLDRREAGGIEVRAASR